MATVIGQRGGLVIDEKILIASATLPKDGFTAEELVVAAFQRFPEDFCLMGFPGYPDSNKVLTQITTAGRGLQRRGWLIQTGTKRYQLTGEAYRQLERLGAKEIVPGVAPDDRDVIELILHWLDSQALERFRAGKKEEINERQALAYWKLTAGSTAARTHRMLVTAESAATFLEEAAVHNTEVRVRHDRRLSEQDAQNLVELHRYLRNHFKEALAFLKNQRR